jgi:Flp pilus assembly secretin CpaC
MERVMAKTKKIGKFCIMKFICLMFALLPAIGHAAPAQSSAGQAAAKIPEQNKSEMIIAGGNLQVDSGKSLVVYTDQELKGISVADPAIANASVISSNKILINGLKAGQTSLLYWNDKFVVSSHDLHVQMDLTPLRQKIKALFPKEDIQVGPSGGSLILSGFVSSPTVSSRAEALAKTENSSVVNMLGVPGLSDSNLETLRKTLQEVYPSEKLNVSLSGDLLVLYGSPSTPEVATRAESLVKAASKNVVSMLNTPHISDVVSLKVRIAEVQRSALQELGSHLSLLQKNSIATSPSNAGAGSRLQGRDSNGAELVGSLFSLTDIGQLFLFQPDTDITAIIKALVQRNLAQVLAEPNLLAVSGKEASFLAGGELPIPIAQGSSGGSLQFTILWKEFGVRLKFVADVLNNELIHMRVAPEVSSLDYANGVSLPGSSKPIPAISTRKAETEIELLNGQSFAIAGLIDNRLIESAAKIPGLGDIPILGALFKSKAYQRNNTELLVLVTPQLVKPLNPDQLPTAPSFPRPFLDKQKFDGKKGEIPAQKDIKQP